MRTKILIGFALFIGVFLIMSSGVSALPAHQSKLPVDYSQAAITGFKYQGVASSDLPITFTVVVPLENLSTLGSLVGEISNPNSPYYRHFISEKYAQQMFTNPGKFNQIVSILKEYGFKIQFQAFSSIIVASGTASEFNQIFGANVDIFSNGSEWYYSTPYAIKFHGANIYATNGSSILFQHPTTLITPQMVKQMKQKFATLNETFSIEPYPTTSLQNVYNITSIINSGITGSGKTIGILDFGGNPYIKYQLSYYDQLYNLPNPTNFTITPIGPYDPNMGIATGWDGEISLDVESSHTMAPGANINLYIANLNLNLAPAIAFIDQMDNVNTLSQSFSIPESLMAEFPAMLEFLNVQLADYYYEIGSLMGITFSASTGDAGGSGYSTGPLGTVGYPSTSPFVTAVGGTTTFLTFNDLGIVSSFYQTAWSNYGFVPNNINYGGSTGGISDLEPRPWYQTQMTNYPSYPNGRMVPDLSLEANVFPGMVFVFGQNLTGISGGTSEASPLFAGLITLIDSEINGSLGLVNPLIYEIGSNASLYSKIFYPITSGYNIPWTENYGYNLVTGWGSLNAGSFGSYIKSITPTSGVVLNNSLFVVNSTGSSIYDLVPGSTVTLESQITYNGTQVKNAKVLFEISTLNGQEFLPSRFNYSSFMYFSTFKVPNNVSGNVFIYSYAMVNNSSAMALQENYIGYYTYIESLTPQSASYFNLGVPLSGEVTSIMGNPVNTTLSIYDYNYNIIGNRYILTATEQNITVLNGSLSTIFYGSGAAGVSLITTNNSYLYLPLFNGFNLQNSFILGPEEVEPGAVAPGQMIFVEAMVIPGYNLFNFNPELGANVTFSLVNTQGKVISSVFATPGMPTGLLVPLGTPAGLYTVLINASYSSYTYGMNFYGEFYGQILVTDGLLSTKMWLSPSNISEGQNVLLYANITYNGSEVQFGMFSAALFPTDLSGSYYFITALEQIPLYFDTSIGLWVGAIQMPSPTSQGSLTLENGLPDWAGNYTIYLTGINAFGVATNNDYMSYLQFNLQNPLVESIQNQLNIIQNEINSNNQLTSSQIASIESELNNIKSELSYMNGTLKLNVSSLQDKLTSLQGSLNTEKSNTQSQNSIAIIAILISFIALLASLVAMVRRRK